MHFSAYEFPTTVLQAAKISTVTQQVLPRSKRVIDPSGQNKSADESLPSPADSICYIRFCRAKRELDGSLHFDPYEQLRRIGDDRGERLDCPVATNGRRRLPVGGGEVCIGLDEIGRTDFRWNLQRQRRTADSAVYNYRRNGERESGVVAVG